MPSFKHFGHEHDLMLLNIGIPAFMCMICNTSCPKGYFCPNFPKCYWVIHKECAELAEQIESHPLHTINNHSLTLSPKTFLNTHHNLCSYCDQPFSIGESYTYSCDQQCASFQMHATCGAVPLPTPIPSDHHDVVVRFNCHKRPMTNLQGCTADIELLCFACRRPRDHQPIYSCRSQHCHNFFHKSCADGLRNRISHPFHHHPLSLHLTKPRSCHSCHKKDCNLLYTCLETTVACTFNLCTDCAKYSKTTVQCRSHDHPLCLLERSLCDDNIHCQACLKSYNHQQIQYSWVSFPDEVVKTRSLLFRCLQMECSFDLHFLCGPLPVRVKYEYHIHPLNLVDSSTIKVDIDSDEYYCDACEEKRGPQFRVYHCADCKYVAHIHCVLVQIMKVIKADTKGVDLEALGENRWDKNLINNEEESIITMRDIISSLTQNENNMLRYPYDGGNLSGKKQRIKIFHICSEFIDSCFDHEKPTEDIVRVSKFFNFGDQDFLNFNKELEYFVHEEGLCLEEKYLRQKVEDVQGYKVPKTVSPILRTLLRKYGDLDRHSYLTPAMKSVCATLLCVTIDRMYKTKVEDLTRNNLRQLHFYLSGIGIISGFEIHRYVKPFDEFVGAFLGFEVIRFEKDIGEKFDVKINTLEADLKKYKENRDKFKTYASIDKSDFMKE